MHKKGVEGVLWMQVFYVVLALLIVIFTYQYLSGKLSNRIFLGQSSGALSLDIDGGLSSPGGKVVIEEKLRQRALVRVVDGSIEVTSEVSQKSYAREVYADGELQLDSGKKAVDTVVLEFDDAGVRLRGE